MAARESKEIADEIERRQIVIVGAGIIGLNVAWALAQQGYGREIFIVAQHMPGDLSIDYTTPWAGGNFSAISDSNANALRWDRISYPLLLAMADDAAFPYIRRTDSFEYWDEMPPEDKIKDMRSYLEKFRILASFERPVNTSFGISFTTVTINAPAHAAHLKSVLVAAYGVCFARRRLSSLDSAFEATRHASLVFNCIGLAAETFEGVQDASSYPTRGQILIAQAPAIIKNVMRHGRDYETYVIPRPNSGGHVVLGGYMDKHDRTAEVLEDKSASIRKRTGELIPELLSPDVEIIAAAVGLRPSHEGGARVERVTIRPGQTVIHNYGAGGTGFQAGMGMALDAISLASQELAEMKPQSRM